LLNPLRLGFLHCGGRTFASFNNIIQEIEDLVGTMRVLLAFSAQLHKFSTPVFFSASSHPSCLLFWQRIKDNFHIPPSFVSLLNYYRVFPMSRNSPPLIFFPQTFFHQSRPTKPEVFLSAQFLTPQPSLSPFLTGSPNLHCHQYLSPELFFLSAKIENCLENPHICARFSSTRCFLGVLFFHLRKFLVLSQQWRCSSKAYRSLFYPFTTKMAALINPPFLHSFIPIENARPPQSCIFAGGPEASPPRETKSLLCPSLPHPYYPSALARTIPPGGLGSPQCFPFVNFLNPFTNVGHVFFLASCRSSFCFF